MNKIEIDTDSNTLVYTPGESINEGNCNIIKQELTTIDSTATHIFIDLCKVRIIDSSGLGMFIIYQRELKLKNLKLTLINMPKDIYSMLALMRLDKYFDIET